MRNKLFWLPVLVIAVVVAGCKKENKTETLPNLTGLSINKVPSFVSQGEELTFTADVSHVVSSGTEDPSTIGLYWQVNSDQRDTLTRDAKTSNPSFTVFATTVGTYVITCNAFADGHYNASTSVSFTVVDPETALTGLKEENIVFLDGNPYPTVTINGITWLARNLYDVPESVPYMKCPVMDSVFGSYLSWEEAVLACPDGWHLPDNEEFDSLKDEFTGNLMADAIFRGKNLWEYYPDLPITNESGFNAIPTGYLDSSADNSFNGFEEYAMWWTADEEYGLGCFRYIFKSNPLMQKGKGSEESLLLPVRCVKD